jgi:hypothetical protein
VLCALCVPTAGFVDAGGCVVMAMFPLASEGPGVVGGRWKTSQYNAFEDGPCNGSASVWMDYKTRAPLHPLLTDVKALVAGTDRRRVYSPSLVTAKAERVLDWGDDSPMVAVRSDKAAPVVNIGFVTGRSGAGGDAHRLLLNAVRLRKR